MNECESWFSIWLSDKRNMLECMRDNLAADLKAGYDPEGRCATGQRKDIEAYAASIDEALEMFVSMTEKQVERWCYYHLLKDGAIEPW